MSSINRYKLIDPNKKKLENTSRYSIVSPSAKSEPELLQSTAYRAPAPAVDPSTLMSMAPQVKQSIPSSYQYSEEMKKPISTPELFPGIPQGIKDFATTQKSIFDKGIAALPEARERINQVTAPLDNIIKKPFESAWNTVERTSNVGQKFVNDTSIRIMNNPTVQKAYVEMAKRTSGTGIYAAVKAADPEVTFQEAYDGLREYQAGDPSKLNQFIYQLGDTIPQTAMGVALNFVPYAGVPLSTAYWAALSASEQVGNTGKFESWNPVIIDVIGDRMLGASLESMFKTPAKTLAATITRSFTTEGGTEVAQDLLKYQDAYIRAKTKEEKAEILAEAKEYFTSGQILMTLGVGGISGAAVGGGAYTVNQVLPKNRPVNNFELRREDILFPSQRPTPENGVSKYGPPEKGLTEEKSRFNTAEEMLAEVGKPRVGPQGLNINRTEARQLIEYMSTLDESKAKERGIVYKPYGGEYNEVDIILGDTGIDSSENSRASGKVVVEATKNPDGTYEISNRLRVHATPIRQDEVIEKLNGPEFLQLAAPDNDPLVNKDLSKRPVGAGYRKMSKAWNQMVKSGTMYPEDVNILSSLLGETKDDFLKQFNYKQNGRLKNSLGVFSRTQRQAALGVGGTIKLQKGIAVGNKRGVQSIASRVFLHEFGHAGYYQLLSKDERAIVDAVYNTMPEKDTQLFFQEGATPGTAEYHASDPQEFFAESFAEYILSNKVPAAQMEPLLKRIARKFFQGLKRLITRKDHAAIDRLRPIYEKILTGDPTTPLTQFTETEPQSFNAELRDLMNRQSKQAPVDSIFPSMQQTEEPPVEYDPAKYPEAEAPKPFVEGRKRVPTEEKINWVDRFTSPMYVLENLGLGDNYLEMEQADLERQLEDKVIEAQIKKWMDSVPDKSNRRIFEFLDGEKTLLNQQEAKVASEIRAWLDKWADRLGLEKGDKITNYITHIFPKDSKIGIPDEIGVMIADKMPGSVYNPYLLERLGAEGYLKDTWKALELYSRRANRKVHMDPVLDKFKEDADDKLNEVSQKKYIKDYLDAFNMRPTDSDITTDNTIIRLLGDLPVIGKHIGPRPTRAFTLGARKVISRSKIAGSAVTLAKNLTQGVNTFSELETEYTLIGYKSLANRGMKAELESQGVLLNSFAENQTYSAIKRFAEATDKVLFANMNASELINRGAAYYGAKQKYLDGNVTPKEIKEAFNRDVKKGYSVTENDAKAYGKYVAKKTQFTFGALDTPWILRSDTMKTIFQFQTFTLKQQEFILRKISNKEWDKLARYLVSSFLLFTYLGKQFGMSWSDTYPFFRFGAPPILDFLWNDLFKKGIIGKDDYGNKLTPGERAKAVGGSFLTNIMPAGAQIKRSYEGIVAVNAGKSTTKSGAFQYKIDKTPMNYIRGTLFGKGNLSEAKAYYDKKNKKASAKKSSSNVGRYSLR